MYLTAGISHSLRNDGLPSSSKKSRDRAYISLPSRIIEEHKSYARKNGHYTESESLRYGIVLWMEGKIEIKRETDEKVLIKEIFEDTIVELDDICRSEIRLKDGLLQKFDEFWLQRGFESRSHAIRMLMYHQILQWKKQHEAILKKEVTANSIPVNIAGGNKRLRQALEELKQKYGHSNELDVVWIPKIKSNKEGEVIGNKIYLYSLTCEEAKIWLEHEYWEYFMKKNFSQPHIDVLNVATLLFNMTVKYFDRKIYEEQEKIIDKFIERMKKNRLLPD